MFCGECGTQNPDTNKFCKNCGKPLRKNIEAAQPSPPPVPVTPIAPQPATSPSYADPTKGTILSAPVAASQPPAVLLSDTKSKINWLAIACVGLSLLSWVRYPYIFGILALVTGAVAIYTARKQAGKVPKLAVIGILIAMGSVILNFSYLDLFAPDLLPPHT